MNTKLNTKGRIPFGDLKRNPEAIAQRKTNSSIPPMHPEQRWKNAQAFGFSAC